MMAERNKPEHFNYRGTIRKHWEALPYIAL